jgi:hypothetical protein
MAAMRAMVVAYHPPQEAGPRGDLKSRTVDEHQHGSVGSLTPALGKTTSSCEMVATVMLGTLPSHSCPGLHRHQLLILCSIAMWT